MKARRTETSQDLKTILRADLVEDLVKRGFGRGKRTALPGCHIVEAVSVSRANVILTSSQQVQKGLNLVAVPHLTIASSKRISAIQYSPTRTHVIAFEALRGVRRSRLGFIECEDGTRVTLYVEFDGTSKSETDAAAAAIAQRPKGLFARWFSRPSVSH